MIAEWTLDFQLLTDLQIGSVAYREGRKEGRRKERKKVKWGYRWIDNHESPLPDYLDSPYDYLHWVHTNQTLQFKVCAYLKLQKNLIYCIYSTWNISIVLSIA